MNSPISREVKLIFELASVFGFFVGLYVCSALVKWVARAGGQFPHIYFNVFCLFCAVMVFALAHRRMKRFTTS